MLGKLNPRRDLRLSGEVIYTGKSSMEVVVKMETMPVNAGEDVETIMLGDIFHIRRELPFKASIIKVAFRWFVGMPTPIERVR